MSLPPALVVFDLGGTTVYDRGEVPAAFSEALSEAGIPFDPAELKGWRGGSKHEVLRQLLTRQVQQDETTAARVDRIYGRFRRSLSDRLVQAQPLSLPGAGPSLERLHDAGIRVAIASGFDRQIVDLVLGSVDWADLLDTQVCSEDVPQGRPAPFMIFKAMEQTGVVDVHRVAVVGDTLLDLEAGWNAGAAYRIAVLTGAHDRDTLVAGPQTHVVDSVADVPGLWL
ncbi:MAG TPA: HAD-IA family hydrolase [Gemmatimonadales bacterium]|jgi:phosphonatase-like hydrolase